MIIANYGTGTAEEAAGWVRYANVEKDYDVTYWTIGNENYGNGHYGADWEADDHADKSPKEYAATVIAYAEAMKAVDPTIKVGPCLQSASTSTETELLNSILDRQPNGQYLPVDFISYHPYQKLGDQTTPAAITAYLKTVYSGQKAYADRLRDLVAASGRDRNSVELISSETNVSNWPTNEPSAPPVAMIGPSAPNGPPVPIAIAEEIGFRKVIRGGIFDSFSSTCSIASGMPWPRIALEPQRAIAPTSNPPTTGTSTTH